MTSQVQDRVAVPGSNLSGMECTYQLESLKDDFEELEENYKIVQRELKCRTREHESIKRKYNELEQERNFLKEQLEQQAKLHDEERTRLTTRAEQIEEELERHKLLLEVAEKARLDMINERAPVAVVATNDTNKQAREAHFKWKIAEQGRAVLQTTVTRLENQVARYKETLEEAESTEQNLRADKRKLGRELTNARSRIEELEASNLHMQKRLDQLRSRLVNAIESKPLETGS